MVKVGSDWEWPGSDPAKAFYMSTLNPLQGVKPAC